MKIYALEAARGRETEVTELVYLSPGPDAPFPEAISRLVNLRRLEVEGGRFTKLPAVLEHLPRLESLRFFRVGLSEAGAVLNRLTQLHHLDLSHNQLTQWPAELRSLPCLESLNLSGNQLTSVPPVIARLKQLRRLDLSDNRIGRMSQSLGKCSHLQYLDLSGNRLRKLPSTISTLEQLSILNLSRNKFKKLPGSITKLALLQRLFIHDNKIEQLPTEWHQLRWLTHLDAGSNHLWTLPEQLFELPRLEALSFRRNKLVSLPSTIQRQERLSRLDLSNNRIEKLPPLPHSLQELNLRDNAFSVLPKSIINLPGLTTLDISGNQLSIWTDDWQLLNHLHRLYVHRNPIRCHPEALLGWHQLKKLEGLIHPRSVEKLLVFLAAARRSTYLPDNLQLSLFRVFQGHRKELASLSFPALIQALSFDLPMVQQQVRKYLLHAFGPGKRTILKAGDKLAILGSLASEREPWLARLSEKGIHLQDAPDILTTHLLLGEGPFEIPTMHAPFYVCVDEPGVLQWLDVKEKRHLAIRPVSDKIDNLRHLLLHQDTRNVQIALQIIQGGGVPRELLTDLLLTWCQVQKEPSLQSAVEALMRPYLSVLARKKLDEAKDLAEMLTSVRLFGFFRYRKEQVVQRITVLTRHTEWETRRILNYLEELTL